MLATMADADDYDVVVVGAGPVGLAAAIECHRRGLASVAIDRGGIVSSLYRYPSNMVFFSTAERIEIAGHPFPTPNPKPTREEALHYYRLVALRSGLPLRLYEPVTAIDGERDRFTVRTGRGELRARRVVLAIGFFDHPVLLGVPGEDRPTVSHYFADGHPYAGQDLLIVGAANSAVIAALECWRCGARVTLVHRGDDFAPGVKYWLLPDIRNRIEEGALRVHWRTEVVAIGERHVELRTGGRAWRLANDFVLLLTGYRPDFDFLRRIGIRLGERGEPLVDERFESASRPGVHVVGCVLGGHDTGAIFIENGREHAVVVADHLAAELRPR